MSTNIPVAELQELWAWLVAERTRVSRRRADHGQNSKAWAALMTKDTELGRQLRAVRQELRARGADPVDSSAVARRFGL